MRYLVLLLSGLLLTNCSKSLFKDDELSIQRTNYLGDELKLDGYYHTSYDSPEDYIDVYFFYRNGVILYGSTFQQKRIDEKENTYRSQEWQDAVKDTKYRWEVFKIKGNSIQFERWYPSERPYRAHIQSGKILNDTTFHVTQFRPSGGSEIKERDEIYHFKSFSPKPDSTTSFIK